MADEKTTKRAGELYNMLCDMLDELGVSYERNKSMMSIKFGSVGADEPIPIIIAIDAEKELVRLYSPLSAEFKGEKRIEAAIVTGHLNYKLINGSFDFDHEEGKILFRLTTSFCDSLLSADLLKYMIAFATLTADEFNDKLTSLSLGDTPIEAFF